MSSQPISRRTLLRGASASLALPYLDAMMPRRASAQAGEAARFVAFFYPNGTDPRVWNPRPGPLDGRALPPCLQDLNGFEAEGIWPAGGAMLEEVTVVTGINHSGVCLDIHMPSLSLSAHRGTRHQYIPSQPTLDQVIAEKIGGETAFRNLSLSATDDLDIGQGHISFRGDEQPESVIRSPAQAFSMLFGGDLGQSVAMAAQAGRKRRLMDLVLDDAKRLQARVGAADRLRLEQYFDAVHELERQVEGTAESVCQPGEAPSRRGGDWHLMSKQFIDLTVLALACDLTRVATVQYSNSWGVHYGDYNLGSGIESVGSWSDHFISHKLDDGDRATDLDRLDRGEAMRIADARVLSTSRFKVRRFAYLVESLNNVQTPTGTLLDETLALYVSENGDGDSHARTNMPILLSGHVGGFATGRSVAAPGEPTGALHASILRRFGIEHGQYGDPAGRPIAEL